MHMSQYKKVKLRLKILLKKFIDSNLRNDGSKIRKLKKE